MDAVSRGLMMKNELNASGSPFTSFGSVTQEGLKRVPFVHSPVQQEQHRQH